MCELRQRAHIYCGVLQHKMPRFNDDHLGFSGPELNVADSINFTATDGKKFSMHNPVSFESTATMAHLPVDDTVTRAVGVDGSGNLVNTNKVASGDLTALTATVNTKADTSTVTALTSTVATKASVTSVATKASSVEVDALADTVADKADTSTVTALTATVGTKADTSTVTALTTTVGTKANTSTVTALTTTVGTKADDSVVVKTSGDQSIGGQKTWTGAQINTGGLYGFGTVSFQGTSSKAVTIQSSNPGGGVNSELRLSTANTTDASNVTYNTGVLKYNSATDTFELDKPLTVTGTIQSTTGMQSPGYNNTVTTQTAQVGSTNGITAAKEFTDTVTFSKTSGTALSCTGAASFAAGATFVNDVEFFGETTIGAVGGSDCAIRGGTCTVQGNLTMSSGIASLRTTTLVAGHDITLTGDSAGGLFARVQALEVNTRLLEIMGANSLDATKVMKCDFASLPMNSGYAANDYITGTGHTNTPQTKKYSNHYQTVFDGTVGTDLTLFTKTQTSVASSAYSVNVSITSPDYSPVGSTLANVIINGTGYIHWGHTSYPANVRQKHNKLIRVGHYVNDAVRITIDGQPVVFTKYSSSMSISGTGQDNFNSMFVARGDWSALEIVYVAGGGTNFMTLQFNVLAAWD